MDDAPDDDAVLAATERWLERAVIGLGLCPFARALHASPRLRIRVSRTASAAELLDELLEELHRLAATAAEILETTLLVHPRVLCEFHEFSAFLPRANQALAAQGFAGVIQIASFHPDYRFADAAADDVANFTNRSPYPTLHLLREASVARALAGHPDPSRIYRDNVETLRRLGQAGWDALGIGR